MTLHILLNFCVNMWTTHSKALGQFLFSDEKKKVWRWTGSQCFEWMKIVFGMAEYSKRYVCVFYSSIEHDNMGFSAGWFLDKVTTAPCCLHFRAALRMCRPIFRDPGADRGRRWTGGERSILPPVSPPSLGLESPMMVQTRWKRHYSLSLLPPSSWTIAQFIQHRSPLDPCSIRTLPLSLLSSESTFSQHLKDKCISEVVRIGSIIIFHLSKLWRAKFFILCDVIFLVKLQGEWGWICR